MLAGSMLLAAQQDALSPELLLLARIRQHMLWHLQRQPNYTCVETVERSHRLGPTHKFRLQDTLRLEVALVNGKEMFAWPGSRKFEDTDLRIIVPDGAIGNGNFALHARSIFESIAARFDYRGDARIDNRPSVRYDFRVPRLLSGYQLRVSDRAAIVGYHGWFYADPQSLDIQRIEVFADDIPRELGLAHTGDRMDYGRMPIGEGEFLLPLSSELSMVDRDGQEHRNHVRFSSCRQFTGESVLTFGDPPAEAEAHATIEQIELPANLGITLSLINQLDIHSAAVGDPVRARLQNDLKHKGRVLFAKGAVATGRITRLEKHDDYTMLGLEFSELESAGARARLQAKLESIGGAELLGPNRRIVPAAISRPGEGLIPLRTGRVQLSRGVLMSWRT